MYNNLYWYSTYADAWLTPWTSVGSAIVETANIWSEINSPKYVFIQKKWDDVISKINLTDFFNRTDWVWIHFLSDNIRDLPDKEISTYVRPYWNWWRILQERLTSKTIDIEVRIKAKTHEALEDTLLWLKSRLNYGWQLQINENWYLKYIDVVLDNFKVKNDWWIWNKCDVSISFLSMQPIKKSWTQTFSKSGLIWDKSLAISITTSNEAIVPRFKIIANNVSSESISSISLVYDNYTIKYTWNITTWDYIDFDWEKWICLFNWVESDFDWVIKEIEIFQQTPIDITFEWDWTIEYTFYMLYNNLSL